MKCAEGLHPCQNPVCVDINADRTVVVLPETIIPEVFQAPMVLRIEES